MSLRQGAIASEQAINRLSGYRWEFPQNRELTGKYRQEPPSEAIGAIDRSRAQFNEAYLEDLVFVVGKKVGGAAMEVAAKQDPTAFVRVATQLVT